MAFVSTAPAALAAPRRAAALAHRPRWAAPAKPLRPARLACPRMTANDSLPAPPGSVPAVPVPAKVAVEGSAPGFPLQVAGLFGLWYLFNIIFNIMNKKVLNAWCNPWILSTVQLGVGSLMVLTQWALGIQKRPTITPKLLKALALPTISHLIGHVSTCISFSYVAVSFSHIVKACEPAFGAVGSAIFLGEVYSPAVYLTLLPIIAGVALSAVTQIQFSWPGFLFAMLSNLAFASRNIFSKQNMGDFKSDPTLTPANIYGIMSIMALLIEIPFALAIEGLNPLPSAHIGYLLAGSGVFYTLYNTVSFMALGKTGVVTHAVGNILKRASVIVVSIIVFGTVIKPLNAFGMVIALLGTCLYSLMKSRFMARQKAQKAALTA